MTDELLAYLMDDLSPERRAEVERQLAQHADWRRELKRLEECLAAAGDPSECADEPPADLVSRTCGLIEHADECGCQNSPEDARRFASSQLATLPPVSEQPAVQSRWSLADWSVGSGVLLLMGCLLAPALLDSRDAARGIACQDNLRWLGAQIFDFQERWDRHLPPVEPGVHAGAFTTKLVELGGVDPAELRPRLVCPNSKTACELSSGRSGLTIATGRQLANAQGALRLQLINQSRGVYAIRIGHFDDADFYHLAKFTGRAERPLLADAPDYSQPSLGGSNHPGGQFVLYEALNVSFRTNCYLNAGSDNIYANAAGNQSAACSPDDTVLSPGIGGPTGPIVPVGFNP